MSSLMNISALTSYEGLDPLLRMHELAMLNTVRNPVLLALRRTPFFGCTFAHRTKAFATIYSCIE